jgi:hypothetical protein
MQSKASTPEEYMNELPKGRRPAIMAMREVILKNLPAGFIEDMDYGMIGYVVPHTIYPGGYHVNPKHPLPFMSIASQKNHIALYHMGLYEGSLLNWFRTEWPAYSKRKPDMGKCCIRFKKPEDIPLDLIGRLASRITPQEWIKEYEKRLKR